MSMALLITYFSVFEEVKITQHYCDFVSLLFSILRQFKALIYSFYNGYTGQNTD